MHTFSVSEPEPAMMACTLEGNLVTIDEDHVVIETVIVTEQVFRL
jgi:hypothetical protein